MKKFLILILIILFLSLAGCDAVIEALETYDNESTDSTSQESSEQVENNNSVVSELYANMPSLPNLNYTNLDLFEDGYQIVDFDHAPDGDTAIFIIDNSYIKTRFFGVDTTEMSPDSGIPEPWAQQAKEFTNDMLNNANEIILELDDNSDAFDNYDRLLAWIWVDGQLLNYMLAAHGFADVKYLYDDYKYNDDLLDAEYLAQSRDLGIWGDDEPYYNPDDNFSIPLSENEYPLQISEARNASEGSTVTVQGIITNTIDNNAFMQDETGGIYIFANNQEFHSLEIGNEIIIEGKLQNYNNLLEIVNFDDSDIQIVSKNNKIEPTLITLVDIAESYEGQYIKVNNVKITFVDYNKNEKGYSIFVTQGDVVGEIRVDKYLSSYPDPASFNEGDIINVTGNIAQHYDAYQIMIADSSSITYP